MFEKFLFYIIYFTSTKYSSFSLGKVALISE